MGYRWLHGVTRGYRELQGVHLSLFIKGLQKGIRSLDLYIAGSVEGYKGLLGLARGYKGLQGVTGGYRRLQRVTGGYKRVTGGYKGLQGGRKGYSG